MKLLAIYCATAILYPILMILGKWSGFVLISWSWWTVLGLSLLVPSIMFGLLLLMAVYLIKTTFLEEWKIPN